MPADSKQLSYRRAVCISLPRSLLFSELIRTDSRRHQAALILVVIVSHVTTDQEFLEARNSSFILLEDTGLLEIHIDEECSLKTARANDCRSQSCVP